MKVVIIDYESGNLHSTQKSFEKAGNVTGHEVIVSNKPEDLLSATHIVLPGVGAFGDCMQGLKKIDGMIEAMQERVDAGTPFLGICVGMQLLASKGLEHGEHEGLGWIDGTVTAIEPEDTTLKVPHMGWNELEICNSHPIASGIDEHDHAYFVHSFHMECEDSSDVIAETGYGDKLTAIIARDNIMGAQFHPEKSQKTGFKIIHNFLAME
jgi:glutamine amidotransferase